MKKAIATKPNEPTEYVDLTQAELTQRAAEGVTFAAEQAATAWLRGRQDPLTGYAPIQEQLDMQYNDVLNNTTTWVDHITKVKLNNPKD